MESHSNILEEMELAAAEQGSTTSTYRRKRRRDEESLEEESWMQELRSTMKANQALLEKLLEERSRAQSDREAFIRYVSDTLRTAPQEQYSVMKELITDIMREGGQSQRGSSRDTQGPSSSWARQQQYYQPQPNYDQCSNWQYGGGYQQQQVPQQPLQTPRRSRESSESVGRLLASTIGEDWNLMDISMGRLSQSSQGTLNTPNLSTTSPGQARPHVASGDQASQVSQADETSADATE